MLMVAILFLLKPDRLEAYPTFAMVGCTAKPALPTLRKTYECDNLFNRVAAPPSSLKPAPGFSPEGGTSLPVCVSHRILAPTQPFYILPMRKHLFQILRN
jgi:hypothetical protein